MQKAVRLGSKKVGPGNPVYIVAEAGSNHNGQLDKARNLIRLAAEAGADAVKFQTFVSERLVCRQERLADGQSLFELFKPFELPYEWHPELMNLAASLGIEFLSSAFDFESADLLERIGVAAFKIASGDLTNIPLVKHIAAKRKPIILSTGMGTISEIADAIEAVESAGCDEVILLHCVSSYPSPPGAMNLLAIETLRRAFGVPVGLSDHTTGLEVPIAATALGIDLLEKHFTEQRAQPGLDHSYSLEPDELSEMIRKVRITEEALGTGEKVCAPQESKTKYYARRSLFARRPIPKGKTIQRDDIKIVRPQKGIEPGLIDLVIGRAARVDIQEDEPITWDKV